MEMKITKGVEEKVSYEMLGIIANFITQFTQDELDNEGVVVVVIETKGNYVELWTLFGEVQKRISKQYKTKHGTKDMWVNFCVTEEYNLLCMDYEY